MADDASRLVYVLPRVRIISGDAPRTFVKVGKAQFWPDEEESWKNAVCEARPRWLDIYRDFPCVCPTLEAQVAEPEPGVARGTLIISDDDDWLKRHVENLVPVVYALGLLENHRRLIPPAEAFQYGGSWQLTGRRNR